MMSDAEKWGELVYELSTTFDEEFGNITLDSSPEDIISKIDLIRSKKYRLEKLKQKLKSDINEKDKEIKSLKSLSSSYDGHISPASTSTYNSDSDASSVNGEWDRLQRELHNKEEELRNIKIDNESLRKEVGQYTEHLETSEQMYKDVIVQLESANRTISQRNDDIVYLQEVEAELRHGLIDARVESDLTLRQKIFQDTFEVILEASESGSFGVSFVSKKELPYITESRVVIDSVNLKQGDENRVKEGDFVMEINGHNTQLASKDDIRFHCGYNNPLIRLTLKRPQSHKLIEIRGNKDSFADYSVRLGILFKDVSLNSYGYFIGLRNDDELMTVNDKKAEKLSPNDIKKKLSHEVTLKIHRKIVPEFSNLTDGSIDRSSISSGGSFNPSRSDEQSSTGSRLRSKSEVVENNSVSPIELGISGSTTLQSIPDEEISCERKRIHITKKTYEFLGWELIGGNKIGIYVKSVGNWSPVKVSGIQVGWKILEVQRFSVQGVAYCYVAELIDHYREEKSIEVLCECLGEKTYQEITRNKPYDFFHVRANREYKDEQKRIVFLKEDTLRIVDTTDRKKWKAILPNGTPVLIPHQPSVFSKKTEPVYQEIPEPKTKHKSFFPNKKSDSSDRLYEFCDEVEVELSGK